MLVTPAPRRRHQVVVERLLHALRDYLGRFGLEDAVYTSPADITWGMPPREADDLVQPDVFAVHPDEGSGEWVKRPMYQRRAVATCWIVHPDSGLVEIWRPADERPAIVTDVLVWRWRADAPELRIPLAELFTPPRVRTPQASGSMVAAFAYPGQRCDRGSNLPHGQARRTPSAASAS